VQALRAAGSFAVNYRLTVDSSGEEDPEPTRRSGQVKLDTNTVYLVSHPTEEATRYTYAEGATAYKKTVFAELDEPSYEVDELGRPLAASLLGGDRISRTISTVEYERAGSVTRDDQRLAVYVANGTDSVAADRLFSNEDISAFSSTLIINPETGVVHLLRTERTTDYLSSGEPTTIVETLRFSEIGSASVEQPAWVDDLKERQNG
jgi:hypothetical protein